MYFSIIVSAICSSEVSSLEKDGSSCISSYLCNISLSNEDNFLRCFLIGTTLLVYFCGSMFNNKFLADLLVYGKFSPNPTLEGFPMLGHKHYFFIFLIEGYIASFDSEVRVETILLFICLNS